MSRKKKSRMAPRESGRVKISKAPRESGRVKISKAPRESGRVEIPMAPRESGRVESLKDLNRRIEQEQLQRLEDIEKDKKRIRDRRSFSEGGMIPSEKKGFNMLPESVQNKIDTDLAAEFMHGGEVEAPSQNVSRGTGAAIKGTKFSGTY